MSCNGCRILRKGCTEDCALRHCLEGIDNPQAQANATIFVSKFFGRAGLMSLISSVPRNQRPSLFQSLVYEAVGRTVNPTTGVVGLLWAGNWHQCQTAVMTVLCGGTIEPQPSEFDGRTPGPDFATFPQCGGFMPRGLRHAGSGSSGRASKRNRPDDSNSDIAKCGLAESPSVESEATTFGSEAGCNNGGFQANETKLLRLFV